MDILGDWMFSVPKTELLSGCCCRYSVFSYINISEVLNFCCQATVNQIGLNNTHSVLMRQIKFLTVKLFILSFLTLFVAYLVIDIQCLIQKERNFWGLKI